MRAAQVPHEQQWETALVCFDTYTVHFDQQWGEAKGKMESAEIKRHHQRAGL